MSTGIFCTEVSRRIGHLRKCQGGSVICRREFRRSFFLSLPHGGRCRAYARRMRGRSYSVFCVGRDDPARRSWRFARGISPPRRRPTLPMSARRRKVHSTAFPPGGENCVRSLAPPLPGEPASLGFAGSNEGLSKTPPGPTPLIKGRCPEGTEGIGTAPEEHRSGAHSRLSPDPIYGGYPLEWS